MRLLINYTRGVDPQESDDEVYKYWIKEDDYKPVLHKTSSDGQRQALVIQGNYTESDLRNTIEEVVFADDFEVGVLYHLARSDSDYESDIHAELPDIECAFLCNYSSGDTTYPLYEKLAEACRAGDDFAEEFDALWDHYAPDEDLEVKLNLLHHCLTPEGAQTVLDQGKVPAEHREQVRALADPSRDCMKSEYINDLKDLRDQVLAPS